MTGTGSLPPPPTRDAVPSGGRAAALVGAGILLSRLLGLVRQRAIAHYLGTSDASDAFTAAFRIPNMLQNLLGEGVLSAAFIPVYSALRARGEDEARRDLAATILALLLVVTSALVLLGILLAPHLVALIARGFDPAKQDLTVRLVRVLFPGAALFVLSAWSLGVLNSHGRFFLSYASGALWNVAMIATLLFFGPREADTRLVELLAWGSVAGSLLQFAIQLPSARALLGTLLPRWRVATDAVRTVVRNFVPVFIGRGVVQISAFVDVSIASLVVAEGAVATLGYAQMLYLLPVSLFGMSVSAAELPAMASALGNEVAVAQTLRTRLAAGLRRIAFFVIPSAVAFVAVGGEIVTLVYGSGRFGPDDTRWVWGVLAGSAVGLVAATQGRLYASAFYALGDTATPLRFATLRVTLSAALAAALALLAPAVLDIEPRWGVAGITMAAGAAAWLEFSLLRRALARRIGDVRLDSRTKLTLWGSAVLAAIVATLASLINRTLPDLIRIGLVLALFGMTYWVATWRAGIEEAVQLRRRVFRR